MVAINHVPTEPLKCGSSEKELNFPFYLIFLNLISLMWPRPTMWAVQDKVLSLQPPLHPPGQAGKRGARPHETGKQVSIKPMEPQSEVNISP